VALAIAIRPSVSSAHQPNATPGCRDPPPVYAGELKTYKEYVKAAIKAAALTDATATKEAIAKVRGPTSIQLIMHRNGAQFNCCWFGGANT